ncbi:MAG TPA: hypothetical protein VGF45_16000, partial [Polyangia bacterium]
MATKTMTTMAKTNSKTALDNARPSRRSLLATTLFGSGAAGLRALATGVPLGFLMRPNSVSAQDLGNCVDPNRRQYLVVSTSGAGDPLNANVPGTYDFADIAHAADPKM